MHVKGDDFGGQMCVYVFNRDGNHFARLWMYNRTRVCCTWWNGNKRRCDSTQPETTLSLSLSLSLLLDTQDCKRVRRAPKLPSRPTLKANERPIARRISISINRCQKLMFPTTAQIQVLYICIFHKNLWLQWVFAQCDKVCIGNAKKCPIQNARFKVPDQKNAGRNNVRLNKITHVPIKYEIFKVTIL